MIYYSAYYSNSTLLMECPFYIKLRATSDGKKLYVKEMNGENNHELSQVGCVSNATCSYELAQFCNYLLDTLWLF